MLAAALGTTKCYHLPPSKVDNIFPLDDTIHIGSFFATTHEPFTLMSAAELTLYIAEIMRYRSRLMPRAVFTRICAPPSPLKGFRINRTAMD